jgi:hypothetical protein
MRLGAFGDAKKFDAGEQAERTHAEEFTIKLLRITSQQNDLCRSIAPHLLATKVIEQLVEDTEDTDSDHACQSGCFSMK